MTEPTGLQTFSAAIAKLVADAAPSIVAVHSQGRSSSGFVWKPGFVVTADESLGEDGAIEIGLAGGEMAAAQIAGRDASTDVALLKVDHAGLTPARLEPIAVNAGELAIAIGSSGGNTIAAMGMVSRAGGSWRSMRGGDIDRRIELDTRLRRQAEGGLAFNASGAAFGMTVFGPRRRVLAIPAATIARVAAELESKGRIARGYLGLSLHPVTVAGGGAGAMVMGVDAQGPAAAAGIHQGDVLVSWNGEPVGHVRAMLRSLGPASVGQPVTLGVQRAGATRDVPLVVAERPAA